MTKNYTLVICPNPSIDKYAWLDGIEEKGANRITKEQIFPGGKGVHLAMAAAELGENVILVGFWGGVIGSWIKNECEKRYPNLRCMGPEVNGLSRVCYTFRSNNSFNDTELLGIGPTVSESSFEYFLEELERLLPNAEVVAMSGSFPMGVGDNAYQRTIELVHLFNKKIVIDCTGIQLTNALVANPYLVHLNKLEAFNATGCNSINAAAEELLKSSNIVAITDGKNGLYMFSKKERIHVLYIVDEVKSAVGSGDCLTAGLLVGLKRELNFENIAILGNACGAANCLNEELGILLKKDVERIMVSN